MARAGLKPHRLWARLFADAYPVTFVPEMKLDCLLLINNYEVSLRACLSHVTKLDLTGSQLDDNHDFLALISELHMLRVLIIADLDNITDKGLKRVLLPCYDGRRLPGLSYLDMAGTRFTAKLLASLRRVTQLQQILFYSDENHFTMESISAALVPWFRLAGRPNIQRVAATSGFGADLLDRWSEVLSEASRHRRDNVALERPAFYGQTPAADVVVMAAADTKSSLKRLVQSNKVMFHRTAKRKVEFAGSELLQGRKKPKIEVALESEETFSDILALYR